MKRNPNILHIERSSAHVVLRVPPTVKVALYAILGALVTLVWKAVL